MPNQPTDAAGHRLALTAGTGAAVVLGAMAVDVAVQQDFALEATSEQVEALTDRFVDAGAGIGRRPGSRTHRLNASGQERA